MRTGVRSLSLWLYVLCSCSLYDDGRLGSARAVSAPDAGASPSPGVESRSEAATAQPGRIGDPGVESCDPGRDCFWLRTQGGCQSASAPSPEQRPAALQSEPELPAFVLAWTRIRLSTAATGAAAVSEGPSFGLDLDQECTGVPGCAGAGRACKPRSGDQGPRDAPGCRDNAYANLWQVAGMLPLLGKSLGLSEPQLNCGLRRGSYTMLLRVSGYNGRLDDSDVRVDFYESPGLAPEQLPSWSCTDGVDPEKMPGWGEGAQFRVAQADLFGQAATGGRLSDSKYNDAHAYVRAGYLVSRFPENAPVRLAGDGSPFRGLHLTLSSGLWMGKLTRASADDASPWRLSDGLVAGSARIEDVRASWREAGLCEDVGFDMFYQTLLAFAQQSADVLANGKHDPETPCDALSVGIPFEATEVQVAGSAPLPPLVMCCAPGATSDECQAECGDGKVSGAERCDTAIAGSCPRSCPNTDPCKPARLEGSGCAAHCVAEPITRLVSGDGCCPPDASPAQDTDCKASVCGNGVLDPGETCDPPGSCEDCPSFNACLRLERSGDARTCTLACRYEATRDCKHGDGCCPEGCVPAQDSDCSAKCGDGVVQPELGETCESGSDKPCLASCDDRDPCTEDIATGSAATCNRACSQIPITRPISGDGCCPTGIHANANTDADCKPVCGNGLIEPGEGCDDGNLDDQDSCSSHCQPIDPLAMCLSQVGARDACSECVCRNCQAESARCYGSGSASQRDACTAVARCFHKRRCFGVDCYCGSDLLGCESSPGGPCRREVEAAAQSDVASVISVRSLDSQYPIGRANAIGQCAWRSCVDACSE